MTKTKWNWYQICQIWPKNVWFQGNSRVPGNSRKIQGMMEFCIENQVPWQKLIGRNALYIKIGQSLLNPAYSRIPGCLDFRVQKSKDAPKSRQKHYRYASGFSILYFIKNCSFCEVAYFLCKGSFVNYVSMCLPIFYEVMLHPSAQTKSFLSQTKHFWSGRKMILS